MWESQDKALVLSVNESDSAFEKDIPHDILQVLTLVLRRGIMLSLK